MTKSIIALFLLSIMFTNCSDPNKSGLSNKEVDQLKIELDSLKGVLLTADNADPKIMTFLTFQKEDAEQAMNFYMELFDNSSIIFLERWGAGAPGKEGTIMQAIFELDGKRYMCSDSPPIHDWDFTPAVSNFVECDSEEELERLFTKLSENGEVAMPLNNYGFSQKFGWVMDQFGISWQLNLK